MLSSKEEKQENFCTKPLLGVSAHLHQRTIFLISPSTLAEVDLFPLLQPPSSPGFLGLFQACLFFQSPISSWDVTWFNPFLFAKFSRSLHFIVSFF